MTALVPQGINRINFRKLEALSINIYCRGVDREASTLVYEKLYVGFYLATQVRRAKKIRKNRIESHMSQPASSVVACSSFSVSSWASRATTRVSSSMSCSCASSVQRRFQNCHFSSPSDPSASLLSSSCCCPVARRRLAVSAAFVVASSFAC